MFTSCTDTLLSVGGTAQPSHGVGRIDGVEEDGFELREENNNEIYKLGLTERVKCCKSVGMYKRVSLKNTQICKKDV